MTNEESSKLKQNAPDQIRQLAAQKRLYDRSKLVLVIQAAGSLIPPVLSASITVLFPSARIWAAAYGLAFPVIDLILLEPFRQRYQTTAASIQELFDQEVLNLPGSSLKQTDSADPETITARASELEKEMPGLTKLRDWYPSVSFEVPIALTRLICQRTNLSFDSELRHRQSHLMLVALAGLAGLNIFVGIFFEFSFATWMLAVLGPLQPAILWVAKEWKRQAETVKTLQRIRKRVESLWEKALNQQLSDAELAAESRMVQDAIFDHRRTSSPVFNQVFFRHQVALEDVAEKVATQLVDQARAAGVVTKTSSQS